jgi:hypothetical protein
MPRAALYRRVSPIIKDCFIGANVAIRHFAESTDGELAGRLTGSAQRKIVSKCAQIVKHFVSSPDGEEQPNS